MIEKRNGPLVTITNSQAGEEVYELNYPCRQYTVQVVPASGTGSIAVSNDGDTWTTLEASIATTGIVKTIDSYAFLKINCTGKVGIRGV